MNYEYVFDSSAWIEFLGGTPKGKQIQGIIEENDIATSVVAIAELVDKCERTSRPYKDVVAFVKAKGAILPITEPIAVEAGLLKNQHKKKHPKFSLVDGIHLATARSCGAILVTADSDFEDADKVMML